MSNRVLRNEFLNTATAVLYQMADEAKKAGMPEARADEFTGKLLAAIVAGGNAMEQMEQIREHFYWYDRDLARQISLMKREGV